MCESSYHSLPSSDAQLPQLSELTKPDFCIPDGSLEGELLEGERIDFVEEMSTWALRERKGLFPGLVIEQCGVYGRAGVGVSDS